MEKIMAFLKRYKRIFVVALSFLLFTGQFMPVNAGSKSEPKGFFSKFFTKQQVMQQVAKSKSYVKPLMWSVAGLGLLVVVGGLIYKGVKNYIPGGVWTEKKAPIVYDDEYNIGLFGFEKLHPFDSKKYGRAYQSLIDSGMKKGQFLKPGKMVTDEDLRTVHSQRYLDSLKNSENVLDIAGMLCGGWLGFLEKFIPNFILQKCLLNPMRKATAGTALAAKLAVENKKNFVNLSGGYHHAKADEGGGFCYFADIPYAVKRLWEKNPDLKVMVVDLDAHQGNGHEDILKDDKRVSIFDVYGGNNYPGDKDAKKYITYDYPVMSGPSGIKDKEYLDIIEKNLPGALDKSKPDLIIYNAGTDPLDGDRVGRMHITKQGLVNRDELVFKFAKERNVPVCMVTSGGYTSESAEVISDSLKNLMNKNYLHKPE
jgi:Deacetylases, including yeast histone deacetylase and acetoin utilization protein